MTYDLWQTEPLQSGPDAGRQKEEDCKEISSGPNPAAGQDEVCSEWSTDLTWPSSPRLHKGLSSHSDWLWVEQPQLSLINQESVSQPATADLNLSCTVRCCRVDAHSSHFMMSTSEVVFVRLHLIGRRENVFTFLILAKRKCASISWCSKNRNNTRFSFFHRVL